MKPYIQMRVFEIANYIVNNQATVREAALKFNVSKSTVHKDVSERLPMISYTLYNQVRDVVDINLDERASRGGQATKEKYNYSCTVTAA